jgi:hypothetical protein
MKVFSTLSIAALALSLAACSGSDEGEAPVAETNVANMAEAPMEMGNVAEQAPPATQIDNTAATIAEEPAQATLTADEQTQDDADATGMTSRVNRNEAEAAE